MRILVFHQFYTRLSEAGISRFNVFAEEWKEWGVQTEVITGSVNYVTGERKPTGFLRLFSQEFDESGVHIVRGWSTSLGFGYRSFLGRVASYGSFLFSAFWAGISVQKPDVIIASSPPLFIGFLGWIIALVRRVPFVFEVRDLWPDELIELGYIKSRFLIRVSYVLERFLYRRAKRIVVNSPGLKLFLVEEKKLSENLVGVVPNPVVPMEPSEAEVQSLRKRMQWEGKCVVFYGGSLSFVYDFDTLLDSAKEFLSRPEILFVVVGDGRQKGHLAKRIHDEKIFNVKILSPVSKKEFGVMVRAADIGVATLRDMRLLACVYATKAFDYMAASKPIVLLMHGVTNELVRAAECGVALEPGNKIGFCRAIDGLSRDPLLRARLGDAGARFLKQHFNRRHLAEQYLELLKPAMSTKKKRA